MYISPHGKIEGLGDRLKAFAERLGTDRTIPFAGLGIIEDLLAAAALVEGHALPTKEDKVEWDL